MCMDMFKVTVVFLVDLHLRCTIFEPTYGFLQVCSTLSFSGAGIFMRMNRGFDVVIIDEAAQAVRIIFSGKALLI